jgi:hypothetical protein
MAWSKYNMFGEEKIVMALVVPVELVKHTP